MAGSGKFTYLDLVAYRDTVLTEFSRIPGRCRLPGMAVDLSAEDRRAIAFFIAALIHLNRIGVTDPTTIESLFPEVFQAEQSVVEGM